MNKTHLFLILLILTLCCVGSAGCISDIFGTNIPDSSAYIYVTSDPAGASVYLGGVYKGETPINIGLLPDESYRLTVEKSGYKTWTTVVQVSSSVVESYYATLEKYDASTAKPTYSSTQVKTAVPTIIPTTTTSVTGSGDTYNLSFLWKYGDKSWSYTQEVPSELYDYYRARDHTNRNYVDYALSDYDDKYIQQIVSSFETGGRNSGYSDIENVLNVVAFVQSLPYTSDSVTTGADEYPRYPVETLVDGGGDCEDSAILTSALLHEMGYGVVLLGYSTHMAVGVKGGETLTGTYYTYQGSRYFYLETTASGWDIGEIPDNYKYMNAIITPLIQYPKMSVTFTATRESYDASYLYYLVYCDIVNNGPGTAKGLQLHASADAPAEGTNMVWDQETVYLDDYSEGATGWAKIHLKIPRDEITKFTVSIWGSNAETVSVSSSTINT
ncbi:MAG: PEGA domain-containing protein [Methanocorpusculum parvum]|jgi:predicted transglutaminase-like cysteine proteinase|nr:PEGA domain-containing protein [Methanocorpusculum parvum]MDY3202982.1 PEGA domain-containing protein [Methanocorpusculum sp.]